MKVGLICGRFNPPTKEHEVLFDNLLREQCDRSLVVVCGRREAPIDISLRRHIISVLYPEFEVPSDDVWNLYLAMEHALATPDIHELHLFGGTGDRGVLKGGIPGQGGSIHEMERVFDRLDAPHVKVVYHPQERGVTSGSVVRMQCRTLGEDSVRLIKPNLHSRFNNTQVREIILLYKYPGYQTQTRIFDAFRKRREKA